MTGADLRQVLLIFSVLSCTACLIALPCEHFLTDMPISPCPYWSITYALGGHHSPSTHKIAAHQPAHSSHSAGNSELRHSRVLTFQIPMRM